jgi:phosphate transport system regulatory protein PhoU
MNVHTLRRFDVELTQLKEHVLSMGGLVERAIGNAVQSMLEQDARLAQKTIDRDTAINTLEVQCDNLTRGILVRHQPAAGDLRFLIAIIKVVTDLERMGDLATGIAHGTLQILERPPKRFLGLETMAGKVQRQVNRALDALARNDLHLAMRVIRDDSGVDSMYRAIYRETIATMLEDPHAISSSIALSNAAKHLERIGDHAKNIAEMAIYCIQGHDIRHVDHEEAARLLAADEEE